MPQPKLSLVVRSSTDPVDLAAAECLRSVGGVDDNDTIAGLRDWLLRALQSGTGRPTAVILGRLWLLRETKAPSWRFIKPIGILYQMLLSKSLQIGWEFEDECSALFAESRQSLKSLLLFPLWALLPAVVLLTGALILISAPATVLAPCALLSTTTVSTSIAANRLVETAISEAKELATAPKTTTLGAGKASGEQAPDR
ncbi:MAG: hypothetical protein K8W52_24320 [Deltaproteobacteria bacterium]|nr:hypothetical protein [Deltaproteobacteria bacterium]